MHQKPAQYGDPLNATEERFTSMVLRGMGPRNIAKETGRSEAAIKNSLRRVYIKLGVGGVCELFAEAYKQQALLLWTGRRGFYPENVAPKPKTPREDWASSLSSKPTDFEKRLVSRLVEEPKAKTHEISQALSVAPGEVHFGLLGLYKKAGVTSRAGLLDVLL